MTLKTLCFGLLSAAWAIAPAHATPDLQHRTNEGAPVVHTKNGSYEGVYSTAYDQDFFMGVPFAQPPLADLRLRPPQPLNTSFSDVKPAHAYSPECVGYGGDDIGYDVSEDCLYLNVIRPSANHTETKDPLPVVVWIYGGGYQMGGTVDKRYNLSFIVDNSVQIDRPMIAVSINYRVSFWGFGYSNEMQGAGATNLGLRDQRLALAWVQENIGAFGGDPSRVTIWGESAGASSVGFHLIAYNGRNDSLFRAAMMESGNPVPYSALNGSDYYQPLYDNVTAGAGCANATDSLSCLRAAPFDTLNAAINTSYAGDWFPTVDGDLIARYPSLQLADGAFTHVPILSGANTDEYAGTTPLGTNTTADVRAAFAAKAPTLPGPALDALLAAYPDDPCVGLPADLGCTRLGPPYGGQYRRAAALLSDYAFIANRRLACETWAKAGVAAFCYRFDARPYNSTVFQGVAHFSEVAFAFNNTRGLGYAVDPFEQRGQGFFDLAVLMSRSWAGFVADLDPNAWRLGQDGDVLEWPVYDVGSPKVIVFEGNRSSFVEDDTFRADGIKLMNDYSVALRR